MSLSSEPKIICFQHCDPQIKVFTFSLPNYCPICMHPLASANLPIPPFKIPFPFSKAKSSPSSIIIKPTEGDFLHNYQNAADLHIGLTNSKGDVYEYDKDGVHVASQNRSWINCLKIPVLDQENKSWQDYWDYTLNILIGMPIWKAEHYIENDHNCYSFVITFLRLLQIKDLKPSLVSKMQFCQDFIVPRTKNAAKYISLYRTILREGYVAVQSQASVKV